MKQSVKTISAPTKEERQDGGLKHEIALLKEQLQRAVATYGHRHEEVERIMSKLDPLIAREMSQRFRSLSKK